MPARLTTRTALISAACALSLMTLVACGSSSASTQPSTAPAASTAASSSAAPADGFAAYRSCLSDNGVTLPDFGQPPAGGAPSGMPSGVPSGMPSGAPGGPGAAGGPGALPDGVDQATFDAAQKACASLAPQMGPGGPGAGGPAAGRPDATALAAFKTCLTDHQVTIPSGDNWLPALDRTDTTVAAGFAACSALLPTPAPSATGS